MMIMMIMMIVMIMMPVVSIMLVSMMMPLHAPGRNHDGIVAMMVLGLALLPLRQRQVLHVRPLPMVHPAVVRPAPAVAAAVPGGVAVPMPVVSAVPVPVPVALVGYVVSLVAAVPVAVVVAFHVRGRVVAVVVVVFFVVFFFFWGGEVLAIALRQTRAWRGQSLWRDLAFTVMASTVPVSTAAAVVAHCAALVGRESLEVCDAGSFCSSIVGKCEKILY